MTSGNSNEIVDTKPRLLFLLVSINGFLFLRGVFFTSFQLDTGRHPRLFQSGPNLFHQQVPAPANPEYSVKPSLSPSLVGPISFPWIMALFPHRAPFLCPCPVTLLSLTQPSRLPPAMTLDTSDCHILCLKCSVVPAHSVQYMSHVTAGHSGMVTEHKSELPPLDVFHLRL